MLAQLFLLSACTFVHGQYIRKRSPIEELEHLQLGSKARNVPMDPYQRSYEMTYAFPPRWTSDAIADYAAPPYEYEPSPEDEAYYVPQQQQDYVDYDMMLNYLQGLQEPDEEALLVERRNRKQLPVAPPAAPSSTTTQTIMTPSTEKQSASPGVPYPLKKSEQVEAPFRPLQNHLRNNNMQLHIQVRRILVQSHSRPHNSIPLLKKIIHVDPLAEELKNLKKKSV